MSIYGPDNSDTFRDLFNCPDLGLVSPKACNSCRIRRQGQCKIKEKPP